MSQKPYVTYCLNTFNRRYLLENLLNSFHVCNTYDGPYEWIISDYGSTDGTREFLIEYSRQYPNITLLFGNEDAYINKLSLSGFSPSNRRQRAHAIFGLSRNEIRKIAKGDMLVEVADDHQFIRRGDWITDALSIIEHRKNTRNLDDISSVIYRGLSLNRIHKKNNEIEPVSQSDTQCDYHVAVHKRYDDYHIQPKSIYEKIGPYLEVDKIQDESDIKKWKEGSDKVNHYLDYLDRAQALNLRKVFMKYPYAIDFPNPWHAVLNVPHEGLICPILEEGEIQNAFSNVDRPISSDEIFEISKVRNK